MVPSHVIRFDAPGIPSTRHATLTGAILSGPPLAFNSQILGVEGVLAESSASMTEWLPTQLGRVRIERENMGRCGSPMTEDRADFAEEYAREALRERESA